MTGHLRDVGRPLKGWPLKDTLGHLRLQRHIRLSRVSVPVFGLVPARAFRVQGVGLGVYRGTPLIRNNPCL